MLDPNPEGTEIPIGEERWDPDEPSPEMLFVRAASEGIRAPLRAARKAARSALTMPRGTASAVMRTAEGFAGLAARGPSAPHTFLNQEIGRDRRVGFVEHRAGGAEARPRGQRRDRQRRDPVDRRRRACGGCSSAAASRSPSSSSRWCR